jgi:hypothetical protein
MVAFFSFSSFPLAEALSFVRKPKSGLTRHFVALLMREKASFIPGKGTPGTPGT